MGGVFPLGSPCEAWVGQMQLETPQLALHKI